MRGEKWRRGDFQRHVKDWRSFRAIYQEMPKWHFPSGIFAYEYLDERGIEVHLVHPTLVKPFAKKHVKTDKVWGISAITQDGLATLEGEIRDLRTIVRHRASLVRLRIKNRVHALLTREGIEPPKLLYLLILSELGEVGRFKRPESFATARHMAKSVYWMLTKIKR